MTAPNDDLASLTAVGLSWRPGGHAGLRGPLLRLAEDCDRAFLLLARGWGAEQESYPPVIPAAVLQRVDYLRSFPQQATFAVHLDQAETNLDRFIAGPLIDEVGNVAPARLAPIDEILTPAACYHIYAMHEKEEFHKATYITTRNTCFRREAGYLPLRRQQTFTMREIVCLGDPAEAMTFLERTRQAVDALAESAGLSLGWRVATDPFFRPENNPRHLLQRMHPVKHEAVYGDESGIAITSANLHHDHFGSAFGLSRDGEPATSACVAFGIERWLSAIIDRHGTDPRSWPDLTAAATEACAAAGPSPAIDLAAEVEAGRW